MDVSGTVREWHDEEGWGVLDSAETPGGCWAHFSSIQRDRGFKSLAVSDEVWFTFEVADQDGYAFRAVDVWPPGHVGPRQPRTFHSNLTLEWDAAGELTRHDPPDVPAPSGGYTNALEVGFGHRLLFISGQIPEDVDGIVPEDAESQCRLVWQYIVACLESAGMGVTDLVKVTTYLSSREVASANTRVRQEVLGDHQTALTVVIADIFDSRWLLEIDAVAAAPAGRLSSSS
jgi:2-iminobutanoate/2-iminopropanoate deaminase